MERSPLVRSVPSTSPVSTSDVTRDPGRRAVEHGRTGGGGLVASGDPVRTCGVAPPRRSGPLGRHDGRRLVRRRHQRGVYDAWPPDAAEPCDVRFEHRASADTNVAIPAGDYTETVAAQVPDRSRLIWAGADHGIDLVAWLGALRGVAIPVISVLIDCRSSTAVGSAPSRRSVPGWSRRLSSAPTTACTTTGRPSSSAVRSRVGDLVRRDRRDHRTDRRLRHGRLPRDPLRFDHETRQLVMSMTVDDLGDADRFQFVVDEAGAAADGQWPPAHADHRARPDRR